MVQKTGGGTQETEEGLPVTTSGVTSILDFCFRYGNGFFSHGGECESANL